MPRDWDEKTKAWLRGETEGFKTGLFVGFCLGMAVFGLCVRWFS